MRQFLIRLRAGATDGKDKHEGTFAAPNALNAIGQACLHFGVPTNTISNIEVVEQHGSQRTRPVEAGNKDEA